MAKKASHIILSLLVFIATTGFTINKHYCGSRYIETTVGYQVHCCDGPCKYCHDVIKYVRITDYFSPSTFNLKFTPEFTVLALQQFSAKAFLREPVSCSSPFSYISPPLKFLGNIDFLQVFRF